MPNFFFEKREEMNVRKVVGTRFSDRLQNLSEKMFSAKDSAKDSQARRVSVVSFGPHLYRYFAGSATFTSAQTLNQRSESVTSKPHGVAAV